ncbi:MAG: hypothetical protein EAZ70_00665 [Runella slithyformis]|nr:MAG: hypothetical protein EAY79_01060 [Runella slithyformis]TAF97301.1 MAG: hypothetical protein EAZ46_02805 [Runella sp.]TAG21652.1 MAG: hypothetical protein EAZ38_07485 [Cytophagales bacterium]TAG41044.1 MAG: hypothetical protein EAZ32_04455 [Cytophagia bacterium]TAF29805.1 MAG: hypothetical protein EAZ70_00665 [Runella slithyformis]
MKALELENYGVCELHRQVKQEVNGGYGYHSSNSAGAKQVGAALAYGCGLFFKSINNQIDVMWKNCAC